VLAQTLLYPKILPDRAVHSPSWKAAVSFRYPSALQLKQQQFMLPRIPGFGEGLLTNAAAFHHLLMHLEIHRNTTGKTNLVGFGVR